MSMRRSTGRDRRNPASGILIPSPFFKYVFDAANLVKDGSNNITSLTDLSGHGYTLTKAAANAPLYSAAALNGYDVAKFDCTGTVVRNMQLTSVAAQPDLGYTTFLVIKIDTGGTGIGILDFEGGLGTTGSSYLTLSTTTVPQARSRTSAGAVTTITGAALTAATWSVLTIRASAAADDTTATVSIRLNGTEQTLTGGPLTYSTIDTNARISLGTQNAAGAPIYWVRELTHYRGAAYLTDAQCQKLEREAGSKYGITVA